MTGWAPQYNREAMERAALRSSYRGAAQQAGAQALGAARTGYGNPLARARIGANAAASAGARVLGQQANAQTQLALQQQARLAQEAEERRTRTERMIGGALGAAGQLVGMVAPAFGAAGAGAGLLGGATQPWRSGTDAFGFHPSSRNPSGAVAGTPGQMGTPVAGIGGTHAYDRRAEQLATGDPSRESFAETSMRARAMPTQRGRVDGTSTRRSRGG
jgi:hypothetical protein